MISVDRAKAILESYGGHAEAWPEDERKALQQVLVNSKSLQAIQKEALALDQFMGFSRSAMTSTAVDLDKQFAQQIMHNLPAQEQPDIQPPCKNTTSVGSFSSKFLENTQPILLVASIFLFAVLSFSTVLQFNIQEETELLTLSDYMDLYVADNTSISEQDLDNSEELEMLAFLEPDILADMI